MIGTFAALESPSMVDLPLEVVIFGRSSTMSTIQRSVEKARNARSTHGRNPSTGRDRTRRAWRWFCDYVSRGRLALRGRKQFQSERERTRLEGAQGKIGKRSECQFRGIAGLAEWHRQGSARKVARCSVALVLGGEAAALYRSGF